MGSFAPDVVTVPEPKPLDSQAIRAAARASRFTLGGGAELVPVVRAPLPAWLAAGYAAAMDWMHRHVEARLDPDRVLPGVPTVMALPISYRRPAAERSRVASYARGRDYHY